MAVSLYLSIIFNKISGVLLENLIILSIYSLALNEIVPQGANGIYKMTVQT